MKKRIFAGITASILALSCAAQVPAILSASAAGNYEMQLNIKLNGEKKAISPYIYGVNEAGNSTSLKKVTTHSLRQGGNRFTGYNWENNYSNAGRDWNDSSDTNMGDVTDGPAYQARRLSKEAAENNVDYKMATLQMAGYVSADKNGTVAASEVAPSSRWNKVEFQKDGALSDTPDLTDDTVYMDEYVNYLINNLGDSTTSTGIQGYNLDNEPVLWNDTHPLLHKDEVSNSELISKSVALAKVVKNFDPNAEIYGPAFWGILPCVQAGSGDNFKDPDWEAVKGQYSWYMDYYLKQMADAEQENGKRLLDVVDVHYYAQDCETDDGILQAARSLYDPNYKENSWLTQWFGGSFPFLTRMQESIDKYYPGTKLALTEYNLANISKESTTGKSVISAIAETEALGAFADQGVYLATYWGTLSLCPYVTSAINLYTNYDGNGGAFGDTLVESSSADLSKAAIFAAIDGSDDSEVTTVISNKDKENTEKAVISLEGTDTDYQSAVVYAITQDSSDIQILDVQNDVSGNQVTVELPPLSVAQVVISDEKTNVTIPEKPNIEIKKTTYNISDLSTNTAGNPMIPLGDKEHLKEIIVNATVSSNAGSSWAVGGGALCFNEVVKKGSSSAGVWGNKSFQYRLGTSDITVPFDDQFTISLSDGKSENITGSCNDESAELQNWWASSENDSKNGEDISTTFNTVTLVYEYNYDKPDETTTTPAETTTTTETTMTESTSETVSETTASTEETALTTESTAASTESSDTTAVSSEETTTTATETTSAATSSEQVNPSAVLYGDVTLDGRVDITDAVLLNKATAGQVELNVQAKGNADCNADGQTDSNDAICLLRFLVHIINTLPEQ